MEPYRPIEGVTTGQGSNLGLGSSTYYPDNQCCEKSTTYANPRQLIDSLIDYHNQQSTNLCALRRALPAEMNRQAEEALYNLLADSLARVR
jgi:hypothetical protein